MNLYEYLQEDPDCRALARGAVLAVAPLLKQSNPEDVEALLRDWAWELAARMPLPWNFHQALDEIHTYLFKDLGFKGDRESYSSLENLVLPTVIQRRMGIPISLSILWLELTRRLGFQTHGIGLPGHFIVSLDTDVGPLYFDPFHGGLALGQSGAQRLVEATVRKPFEPEMLSPLNDRRVLVRLVRNLHVHFLKGEHWNEALWTSTHLILLEPTDPQPLKERAYVRIKRGEKRRAIEDIHSALELTQDPDLESWLTRLQQEMGE